MESQIKICQNCKKDFIIEPEDFLFYEKIKVPPPTFCWKCRLARKLVWRNERSLYKRTCDLCKRDIISMYKTDAIFPVYCHECWWGDVWNPIEYSQEYDFNTPFFKQFRELQKKVPRSGLYAAKNVDSDYCNYTAHMKGGYYMFGSWFSENCGYGQTVLESKDCWDCLFIKNCQSCFASVDCTVCANVYFSQNSSNCLDSAFLYDCRNCQNCLFSYNLRNKNYYIFNNQISKEEFHTIKLKIFSSYSNLQKTIYDFKKLIKEKAFHKYMTGEHNNDVTGDFIYNSKNVHESYYINDGENEKYAVRGGKGQKDSLDIFGVHGGELVYESNNIDFSSRCYFSVNGENNLDSNYLVDCDNVKNSFGCIALRKKEYCILNKQYTKEEYEFLVPKIITHMNEMPYIDTEERVYTYGEFFPISMSPHAYNETLAQEYVPVNEKEAKDRGYVWDSPVDKNYVSSKNWKDLPDSSEEIEDSITTEIILCEAWDVDKKSAQSHKCTKAFKITPEELTLYKKWNIPLPRRCPNTRNFELSQQRNSVNFWHRSCMCDKEGHNHTGKCEVEFETSYAPERPEIIYCKECYLQEIL